MDPASQGGRLVSLGVGVGVGGVLADDYGVNAVPYLGGALQLAAAGFTATTEITPPLSGHEPRG